VTFNDDKAIAETNAIVVAENAVLGLAAREMPDVVRTV
jgi:hypothetical protein